jgi:rubrerythrin
MKIEEKQGKFIITSFDEFEAYRIACKIEQDGIRFYGLLAQTSKDAEAKKIFAFLLEEEKKHLAFFERNLSRLRQAREDRYEDDDLVRSMDFGIFKPYQGMEGLNSIVTDIKKALALGIVVEDKSIRFYQACRDDSVPATIKRELERIIEEEKKHKKLFEALLEKK